MTLVLVRVYVMRECISAIRDLQQHRAVDPGQWDNSAQPHGNVLTRPPPRPSPVGTCQHGLQWALYPGNLQTRPRPSPEGTC